jgi:hypothetical protein
MPRDTITCRYCHGVIGPHWQVFEHITCTPTPKPEPAPSADATELQQKAREAERQWHRLNRRIDRLTGRGYRWS